MKVEDLKFDKRNYRRHNERNQQLIKKSIEEVGFGRSIVVDADNEIVCGNGVVSQIAKSTPIKVVETNGSELIVVKRTDLKTDDDRRKQLAVMDNSASDTSDFDLTLLQEDFEPEQLGEWGITAFYTEDDIIDEEEIMNNDELQEMNTSKCLALSKMPISTYIVIKFDENCSKADFIEYYAKKLNPKADIDEKTQFCTYAFMKKDILEDD